ncbi:MAG: metallophosphoesterase [Deltaproteobacteria bacterium]|nr:metallophosphoesterase [Deltaproteobacteria bacterium]
MLTLGVITDLHIGPRALHEGKLRKLSDQAGALASAFVERMRSEIRPQLVVNLGDVVQDEAPEVDRTRYEHGLALLRKADAELVNVAGNHDQLHLDVATVRRAWQLPGEGPLHYSFDREGCHFVVLYTHERVDQDVRLGDEQLRWLDADLAGNELPCVVLMHHPAAEQDLRGNYWFEGRDHVCLVADRRQLRELLQADGRTFLVLNGHAHWNHLAVIGGIPYITFQSPIENIEEDEPGVAAATHGVVRIDDRWTTVEVAGRQPARYQLERR